MAIDAFETLGYLEIQSLVYSAFPLEINIFIHTHTHTCEQWRWEQLSHPKVEELPQGHLGLKADVPSGH